MNQFNIFLLILALGFVYQIQAQSFSQPVEYIEYFNQEFNDIQDLQIEYSSFLVHTRSELAEKKRQELLTATKKIHDRFTKITPYQNDKGMRATAIQVLDIMLEIGNKNYSQLATEKTGCLDCFASIITQNDLTDKDAINMGKVMQALIKNIDDFAKTNKVELTSNTNQNESILGKINRINNYTRQLDLVTLELEYANSNIVHILNEKNIDKAKESIKAMNKAAANASKRLKNIERIKEDATSFGQAEKLIDLYKEAAKNIYPDMLSCFDKKGEIINEKVNLYNKSIQKINSGAGNCYQNYLNAKQNLQERHIPKPQGKVMRS